MSEQGSGSFARASNFTEIKITKPNRDIIVESRGKTIGFNNKKHFWNSLANWFGDAS